jgi:hypothetical protein
MSPKWGWRFKQTSLRSSAADRECAQRACASSVSQSICIRLANRKRLESRHLLRQHILPGDLQIGQPARQQSQSILGLTYSN